MKTVIRRYRNSWITPTTRQRKTHLQAAEQQAQIAQLQRENASLQREAQRAQAEFDQAQEDLDLLRAEVHSAQRRAELKHGEDRSGQLVWKTTARSVHVFMETLPPNTRDRYATLRKALREEYSLYTDEASATLGAFAILQKKHEPPWVDLTFQEMTLVHPLHICTLDTEPLLIGQDLLDRLAPLIDCHRGHIWAQVDTPKPLSQSALGGHVAAIWGTFGPRPKLMPLSEPDPGSDLLLPPPATIQPASAGSRDSLHSHESFLCALKNTNPALYSSLIIGGMHLNGISAPDALLALWSEKSAISQDSYNDLCLLNPSPTFAPRSHRLLSAQTPQTPIKAVGVCALSVRIGRKEVVHLVGEMASDMTVAALGRPFGLGMLYDARKDALIPGQS
ncbi:hypothetical protein ABVT39_023285 [Epinephelus coioides]